MLCEPCAFGEKLFIHIYVIFRKSQCLQIVFTINNSIISMHCIRTYNAKRQLKLSDHITGIKLWAMRAHTISCYVPSMYSYQDNTIGIFKRSSTARHFHQLCPIYIQGYLSLRKSPKRQLNDLLNLVANYEYTVQYCIRPLATYCSVLCIPPLL